MPNNISSVQCKLIGISCLEGDVRQQVRREWDERFYDHEAFWVDAKAGQSVMNLAQSVAGIIRSQGITSLGGKSLLLTVFLDLTKAPDMALLGEILRLPQVLARALNCIVPLTLEFGYVGMLAWGDTEALKANTRQVVDLNCQDTAKRKQLCLVGISPLWQPDEDISWKSVMVCLDVLRRDASPGTLVPFEGTNPCNNVGFLRYGEYDEEKLEGLQAERSRIEQALSDNGELALRNEIAMALGKIENDVETQYPVDGACQPIHPKMYPEGMIERWNAQHGNPPFAVGRTKTLEALAATTQHMKQKIIASFRAQIADAPAYLRQYMKKAEAGIDLESNRKKMEEILAVDSIGRVEPQLPALDYKETGYTNEIDNYLKGVRRYMGAKIRQDFAKALLEAYRQIPDSSYAQRKRVLDEQKQDVDMDLGRLTTKSQLLGMISMGSELPGAALSSNRAAGLSFYFGLTRDENMGLELDKAIAGTMAFSYFIDATNGGLKMLDNAPLKALQLLQFDCCDACLTDLIG